MSCQGQRVQRHEGGDDAHVIDVRYDLHADDVTVGYRFVTDELETEHDEHGVVRHGACRLRGAVLCSVGKAAGYYAPITRSRARESWSARSLLARCRLSSTSDVSAPWFRNVLGSYGAA